MQRKDIKVESTKTVWVAADGREFNNSDECIAYENSFRGAIRSMISQMAIKKMTEYSFFTTGCDDNTVYCLKPKDKDDILRIKQYIAACNADPNSVEDSDIGKELVLTVSYNDEYAWIQSLDSIIAGMRNAFVPVEKK